MTTRAPLSLLLLLMALTTAPGTAGGQGCPSVADVTQGLEAPLAVVRYLADDRLDGRRAGTDGERCAGDFIAGEFRRIGLEPGGTDGTYFQRVSLASALNPHAGGGTGRNVLARLAGADPALRDEWVVIGAHYDHLGEGGMGSLAPNVAAIHNGADDNASGVSAMLETARRLAAGVRPARSVLFIAFTGEESGLLGSAQFVASPLAPRRMTAMINLDMVGRLGAGTLVVYGVDTAEEWRTILPPAAESAGVTIGVRGEGYGPSDHTSFYTADVPVLHLFTNTHGDYHKPSDDWDKIDVAGLRKVVALVTDVAGHVANRRPALTLRRGAGEPMRQSIAGGMGASTAYLGTVPDFTPVDRGVRLSGVTKGSPGDAGGLAAGDVLIGIGTHAVDDLQGMTDALRAHKPGDVVAIRVLRDGQVRTIQVTLGSRGTR